MDRTKYQRVQYLKQQSAARRIQRWWRYLYWHPDSRVCHKRLYRSLSEIEYTLRVFQYEQDQKSQSQRYSEDSEMSSLKRYLEDMDISDKSKKRARTNTPELFE